MADLFSSLTIAGRELPNRIVAGPAPSGFARHDGFANAALVEHYARRARGGVGLVIIEAARVAPPAEAEVDHLGAYADVFVPGLRRVVTAVRAQGARVLLALDEPELAPSSLHALCEQFVLAAWRAHCAGADGVMLSAADGGLLHSLVSPLRNQRADGYGLGATGRLRMPLEIVEGLRRWLGSRLIIGFRLLADEFVPGGLSLQDARVLAKRLTAAGVGLLDVTVAPTAATTVARFPGWAVPLANSIKRITEVPVIGSGLLGDPQLADSVVRDGSVDLVMLGRALALDPDWPRSAYEALHPANGHG